MRRELVCGVVLWVFCLGVLASCAEEEPVGSPDDGDPGIEEAFFDTDGYGKPLLGEAPPLGKDDSLAGRSGPAAAVDASETAVWEVRNQWADTDTAEARAAGIAWAADSGLDWDQKYALWIESMARVDGHETYYETFQLTTPWGKTLPAPSLECAETSIFLRVTFASWYGLPFYMEAVNGRDGRVYFGHFGARTATGKYANTPNYKTAYRDHGPLTAEDIARDGWPSDAKLRAKRIAGTSTDDQPFIAADAHAGAYFDEIFVNKRVGHFLVLMLSYFGSVNLADSNNTFNLVPSAVRPGDTLLERWQRRGIGHTLVVKDVNELEGGRLEAELVSGSMPRRQPKWEDGATSKRAFTLVETGGLGTNSAGEAYWSLGGGIKRWRVAKLVDGRYRNTVPARDQDVWIADGDRARIEARPAQFEVLLGEVDPTAQRDVLLRTIEDQRNHLRRYPASCSARTRREEAFAELYTLNEARFGLSRAETDAEHRILEDYVFAELVYEQSKTCCWNSTTAAMHEIAMDLNDQHVRNSVEGTCNEPLVFKNEDGGYETFRQHAIALGREAEWVAWSEDEPCAQRAVTNDTEKAHGWAPFCAVRDTLLGLEPSGPLDGCVDRHDGNATLATAVTLAAGTHAELAICTERDDWFRLPVAAGQTLAVEIVFDHDHGDLDLELVSPEGNVLDTSNGVTDTERLELAAPTAGELYVRIYGYNGASNHYTLTLDLR